MTTKFTKATSLFAAAEMHPDGPHIVITMNGTHNADCTPKQAADFAAFLINKAVEALALHEEPNEICHWITNYILATDDKRIMIIADRDVGPIVDQERLLINARILYRLWSAFIDEDKPSIGAIEKALGDVCYLKRVNKYGDKYRHINLLRVKHWAVSNGVCGEGKFDEALAIIGLSCEPLDTIHTTDG